MRFQPIKLNRAFDLWNSIWFGRDFMKKSVSKVYYVLLVLNKGALINFQKFHLWMADRKWKVCGIFALSHIRHIFAKHVSFLWIHIEKVVFKLELIFHISHSEPTQRSKMELICEKTYELSVAKYIRKNHHLRCPTGFLIQMIFIRSICNLMSALDYLAHKLTTGFYLPNGLRKPYNKNFHMT